MLNVKCTINRALFNKAVSLQRTEQDTSLKLCILLYNMA